MIACEHCNDLKICLLCCYIFYSYLPNLNPDLAGFVKIKPRHPDGLEKTDLGGKPAVGALIQEVECR